MVSRVELDRPVVHPRHDPITVELDFVTPVARGRCFNKRGQLRLDEVGRGATWAPVSVPDLLRLRGFGTCSTGCGSADIPRRFLGMIVRSLSTESGYSFTTSYSASGLAAAS
jgi:hypothetical protein